MKEFIYNRLLKDNRFKESAMEKVVKILNYKKSWRRPDVSAIFENKKIVFEIQLQTTYLNVIVEREEDYKSEKTYIMWFFDNTNIEKFRFSEEDIFYANKSNAFIITNETMKLSINENKFLFECHYKFPFIKNNKINEIWQSNLISFDDLKFDNDTYKVYYYDFEKEYKRLHEKIRSNKVQVYYKAPVITNNYIKPSRNMIESSLNRLEECNNIFDCNIIIDTLKPMFEYHNTTNNSKIIGTIVMLYSIKKQKVYGWKNDSLIWALNNFFQHYKKYTHIIIKMISSTKQWDMIVKKDGKHSFRNKVNLWKNRNKEDDIKIYDEFFIDIFPELGT